MYPTPELGSDCTATSPDDCGVPLDATIQLRFDRYLLPSTAVRQSIKLYTGTEDVGVFLQGEYDVVERVLVFNPNGALKPGVLYTFELVVPTDDDDFGFRAFDGQPLREGPVPLKFDFRMAKVAASPPFGPPAEAAPTCEEVVQIFKDAGCAGTVCHNAGGSTACPPGQGQDDQTGLCADVPRMGLELNWGDGLLRTAISKVAHQTEVGAKTGVPLENAPRLGIQMPIVAPGRPENSYLMYKLLRREESFQDQSGDLCGTRYAVGFGGGCLPPSAEEAARLRESVVRGDYMPPPGYPGLDDEQPANHRSKMRAIQAWIRAGAPADPDCL